MNKSTNINDNIIFIKKINKQDTINNLILLASNFMFYNNHFTNFKGTNKKI